VVYSKTNEFSSIIEYFIMNSTSIQQTCNTSLSAYTHNLPPSTIILTCVLVLLVLAIIIGNTMVFTHTLKQFENAYPTHRSISVYSVGNIQSRRGHYRHAILWSTQPRAGVDVTGVVGRGRFTRCTLRVRAILCSLAYHIFKRTFLRRP
jgi:hypothetical protein